MIRILYFSTAHAGVKRQEVEEIARLSQLANEARDVTGALAFNGRNFCQVLEGEESTVRALVDKIKIDSRHAGFKIVDEKQVETRHFADWSMKLVDSLDFDVVINAMNAA